jgi:hypothetical protein
MGFNPVEIHGIGHKGAAHFVTQTAYSCAELYAFLSNFNTFPRCVDGIDIGAGSGIEPASG